MTPAHKSAALREMVQWRAPIAFWLGIAGGVGIAAAIAWRAGIMGYFL